MGSLKKIIQALNQPIGGTKGNDKASNAKREKNLKLKVMELAPQDAIKNTKNIRYRYKVRDKQGNITDGKLDALSKLDVHSFLMNQGYDVINIEEDELFNKLGLVQLTTKQMKEKDLNFFLTQLSTYIKAGIPLIDSINILAKQARNKKTRNLYNRLVFELTTGETFSEALSKQGPVFPKLLINMIKTSELTGNLTGVLDDMADYYKTIDENRKQIISAMTYPTVIFIIAIVVLVYIVLFVVPEFTDMYAQIGSKLPPITTMIVSVSNFLAANLLYVILVIIAIFTILTILYKNVTTFRYWTQWTIMHIPVVKNIVIYKEVIMFTKTFASLINYDVFITDSMEILGKETIDSFNTSETRGRELSHGLNYQKLGKQLMTEDEIAVMDGGKCILQLRGVRPFFSDKFDITKHPKYKYLSDADPKNAFDMEKHLKRRPAIVKPDEVFDYYEIDAADLQEDADHEET